MLKLSLNFYELYSWWWVFKKNNLSQDILKLMPSKLKIKINGKLLKIRKINHMKNKWKKYVFVLLCMLTRWNKLNVLGKYAVTGFLYSNQLL